MGTFYLWKHKSIKDILKRRASTLLIPYYSFMIFYLLIENGFHLEANVTVNIKQALRAIVLFPTDNANMPIASAMWFLPCLFLSSVIYCLLDRFKFKTKAAIVLLISVCGAVYSFHFDYMLPLTLEPTAAALLFMLAGEFINKNRARNTFFTKKQYLFGLLFVEAVFAFVNGSVDLRSARFHIIPLYYINGIIGTIAYYGIANRIVAFQGKLGVSLKNELIDFGEYSIVILCIHQLLILFMINFLSGVPSGGLYEVCSKTSIFVITMLLCKLIIRGCKAHKAIRRLFGMA